MGKAADKLSGYGKLKYDITALKEYIAETYGTEAADPHIDGVLTEMNDLLFGIGRGQLVMPYRKLLLASAYHALDGAYQEDSELEKLIYRIQDDIYSLKKYIVISEKPSFFFRKRRQNINWMFPNLDCGAGDVQCISYRDEDMITITFSNGYEIDLGFYETDETYILTVTKDDDWNNIAEEKRIKLRSKVEESLQDLIYKYEKM